MEDAITAIQKALAAHLNAALPTHLQVAGYPVTSELAQRVEAGWAEPEQEILEPFDSQDEAPKRAVVSIETGPAVERRPYQPTVFSSSYPDPDPDPSAPKIDVLYEVGELEIPLTLTVWAKSKAERSALALALRTSLQAGYPDFGLIYLTLAGYHNALCSVRIDNSGSFPDSAGLVGGAWWLYEVGVTAEVGEIIPATHPRLTKLILETVVKPPEDATAETTTVFEP